MGFALNRTLWNKQPDYLVKGRSDQIASGLVASFLPRSGTWAETITGQVGISINTPTNSIAKDGRKVDYLSGNSEYTQFTTAFANEFSALCNGDITLVTLLQTPGAGGFIMGFGSSSDDNPLYYIQSAAQLRMLVRSNNSAAVQFSAGPTITDGVPHVLVLRKKGTTIDTFVDGVFAGTGSAGFDNWNSVDQFSIGNLWRTSPASHWTGGVYGVSIWNRSLDAFEIKSLANNFWQIYRPTIHYIPAGVAGISDTIIVESGSYSITGTTTPIIADLNTVAGIGSYALTGTTTPLKAALNIIPVSGSYAISGTSIDLRFGSILTVDSGSYVYTGTFVNLNFVGNMTVDAGSYIITGTDVGLISDADIWTDLPITAATWVDGVEQVTAWTDESLTITIWTDI